MRHLRLPPPPPRPFLLCLSVWVSKEEGRMQRYTAREIWQMEECQSPRMGCNVVLGVDGGASNTVCVCIPAAMPFADPLPVLSRAIAGCSNQNSVGESAEGGDEVANKILHNSVGELASSVKAVVQRLALSGQDGKDLFPLVMVGKVLEANNRWDIGKEVIDCVNKTYPGAYPIHPEVEPAVGAALLAWNAIASELDGDITTVV